MKIGILGNGQLGQMLQDSIVDCQDISVVLYDLRNHSTEKLECFLQQADRLSFETENIPEDIVAALASVQDKVYPSLDALKVFQNRLQEKNTLRNLGIPTVEFCAVNSREELQQSVATLGFPILLKTTTAGYDGKGQYLLQHHDDLENAWNTVGKKNELIAEAFVPFLREVSVIGCRDQHGNFQVWPMTENFHHGGILRYSRFPALNLSAGKQAAAREYLKKIVDAFGYVGTVSLELFETEDGLIANEVAPRVHNSGHWSIEGAETSQFRNHMLAISGLTVATVQENIQR